MTGSTRSSSTGATAALLAAAEHVWQRAREHHQSATIAEICDTARVVYDAAHLVGYRAFWEHATFTDDDVPVLFGRLRDEGIKVGVLSNTVWPRARHEEIFERDGTGHLIDGAVYTSDIAWTKPAPEAFRAAMTAVGATDPARYVFVGDRLFDDIWGAAHAGMRTILVPPATSRSPSSGIRTGLPTRSPSASVRCSRSCPPGVKNPEVPVRQISELDRR